MAYRRKTRARSLALCASTILAFSGSGAQAADQFKQAADGASIECAVSARELTRFALVDDQFASVSKISTGTPYNDFAVTNEPLRGDIYVSVPETFAARSISFFATTKKGFVYKVSCQVEPVPAVQVFITNPAIATNKAAGWESETPLETSAVRLIQAMANDRRSKASKSGSPRPFRHGSAISRSSSSPITAAARSPERSSAWRTVAASR
jgi:conjugal transfer pilus assembly protein TraK